MNQLPDPLSDLISLPNTKLMPHFTHHVFFCCNQRDEGKKCCNGFGADEARAYAKDRIAELGRSGKGQIRINTAGCLGRCSQGPVIAIYPEEVWYTYATRDDIEEIIQEHLINGRIVDRLRLPA